MTNKKKKTSLVTWLVTIIFGLILVGMFSGGSDNPEINKYERDSQEKIVKLFKSSKEKTAKDAIWTKRDIFKVGVISDGSNRNGYAEYVCSTLYEHGFKGKHVWVQVIDIMELTKNEKWVKLGEARCI
ncbi:MAG: hypothetical protein QM500_00765 [Methylococcales bacterium]